MAILFNLISKMHLKLATFSCHAHTRIYTSHNAPLNGIYKLLYITHNANFTVMFSVL